MNEFLGGAFVAKRNMFDGKYVKGLMPEKSRLIDGQWFTLLSEERVGGGNNTWWVCRNWQNGMGLCIFGNIAENEEKLQAIVEAIRKMESIPRPGQKHMAIPCDNQALCICCHGKSGNEMVQSCRYVVRSDNPVSQKRDRKVWCQQNV